MLDERDLQAIAQLIDSKLQESEQRTMGAIKESEQRTMGAIRESEQRTMGAIRESEQRTMGAIKESEERTMQRTTDAIRESEQRTMQGAAALMESYFEPKFQLLAEGIQSLQETQIPRERFENLEEEVAFLRTIVRQHSREIEKLKHA